MDSPDPDLLLILSEMCVSPLALLGGGGEAQVYAIDETRVVRVCHKGADVESVRERQLLLAELGLRSWRFALPEVIEVFERHGRIVSIERRLKGTSLLSALSAAEGAERAALIEAHLSAAASIGDLVVAGRGWFGQLCGPDAVRASTWREFLRARAAASLEIAGYSGLADPFALEAELPECERPELVHLDAFAGNMLVSQGAVTAVVDFGATCLLGDRRLDPVSAAIYLGTPSITPTARRSDLDVAQAWLRAHGLDGLVEPVRRWLAAFWSFGVGDPKLQRWCREVLTGEIR